MREIGGDLQPPPHLESAIAIPAEIYQYSHEPSFGAAIFGRE